MPRQGLRRAPEPSFPSEDGASGSTSRDFPRLLPSAIGQRRHRRHDTRGEHAPVDSEPEDEFQENDEEDDDDEDDDEELIQDDGGEEHEYEEEDEEGQEEEEEEEDLVEKNFSPPIPPNLREISSLASWTVSTYKPGSGVVALRHPSPNQFWQSDGPQPHTLTLHFFKRVAIVRIRVYLDFELDESYTPTKMIFLAGMGGNDLVEFATWQGESPCGWVDVNLDGVGGGAESAIGKRKGRKKKRRRHHRRARRYMRMDEEGPIEVPTSQLVDYDDIYVVHSGEDPYMDIDSREYVRPEDYSDIERREEYEGEEGDGDGSYDDNDDYEEDASVGNVLKAMVIQVKVCENHQNGKDTHVRGFQVFARDDKYFAQMGRGDAMRKSLRGSTTAGTKVGGGASELQDLASNLSQVGAEQGDGEIAPKFDESDWFMEPELR